ncbi:MAG TPA: sugar transferase [Candidatus Aquicultor sp.]|jgi:undecaprenyl-phosphate galactose phosphotransferase
MSETSQDLAVEASVLLTDELENVFLPGVNRKQTASQFLATLILTMTDLVCVLGAFFTALIIRMKILPVVASINNVEVPKIMLNRLWMTLSVYILCLTYEGLHTERLSYREETKQQVKAITLAFMLAIISLGQLGDYVSRTVLVLGYLMLIVLLPAGRLMAKKVLAGAGLRDQPVIMLGAGKTGKLVANSLLREKYMGYRIAGFFNDQILKRYLDANPVARHDRNKYAWPRGYDPRLTRVGSLLRKFSLGELPQILNVLKDGMSLVDPCPYPPRERLRLINHAAY